MVIELGGGGGGGGMKPSAFAHCVGVLVCTLGMSLCRCSFVCVRQSIFYVCVTHGVVI